MPLIRTAARALIVRDGALLVACYRDKVGEWFTLPGGGQKHGEELTATLVRECHEETGFTVRIGALRFVREVIEGRQPCTSLPADFHQVEHVFECEIVSTTPRREPLAPDPTQTGCRWVPIAELKQQRFFPQALLDNLDRTGLVYLGATN